MYTFTLIDGNSFEGNIESEALSIKLQKHSHSKTLKIDMSKIAKIVREDDIEDRISPVFKYFVFTFIDGSRLNIGFDRLKVSAIMNKDEDIKVRYRDSSRVGKFKIEQFDKLVTSLPSAIQSDSLERPHYLTLKNNQEIRGTMLLKSFTLPGKGHTTLDEIQQINSLENNAFEFKCKDSQRAIQVAFPGNMESIKVETSFCFNRFFPVYIQDLLSFEAVDNQAYHQHSKIPSDSVIKNDNEGQWLISPKEECILPSWAPGDQRSKGSPSKLPQNLLWIEQIEQISNFLKKVLKKFFFTQRKLPGYFKIGIFGRPRTGKTTYIALLFYILTKAKIDGVYIARVNKRQHPETAEYLKEIKDIFTEATNWDDASERIYRTVRRTDLYLDVIYNGKKFPIQISDYDGKQIGPDVEGYRLTHRDFVLLSEEKVPDECLKNLNILINREFTTKREFLAGLNELLGQNGFDTYKDQLLKYAESHRIIQDALPMAKDEKEEDDVVAEDYLLQCDAIMLFYALQESYDNRKKGLNSPEEFNAFLNDLRGLKPFYKDIPVILVITKHDLIVERKMFSNANDAIEVLTKEQYLEQLQHEYFREEYKALKTLWGKELPYLAISAKEAFEYYIQPNNDESAQSNNNEFPGEYNRWFKKLSAPLEELFDQLQQIERKEVLWGIIFGLFIGTVAVGILSVLAYIFLFQTTIRKWNITW